MSLYTATGAGQNVDGKEASLEATRQALDRLGKAFPALALVFTSSEFPAQEVLAGVTTLLGSTPVLGISTRQTLAENCYLPRAVAVTLIGGDDIKAQAGWFPGYATDSQLVASQRLMDFLDTPAPTPVRRLDPMRTRPLKEFLAAEKARDESAVPLLFLGLDGLGGNAELVCTALNGRKLAVAGCLSGGKAAQDAGYQIAGNQAGAGGLAAALLSGSFQIGMGSAHGWQAIGPGYTITSTEGHRILGLDGNSPALVYSQVLGHTLHEWVTSPLNELIRLYPLGIDNGNSTGWVVRSPIKVESDGSLLMNAPVHEGSIAYLLVGSAPSCLEAAQAAARQAMAALSPAQPALALVFADAAWQWLMEPEGYPDLQAIRSVIGKEVPLAGGYSYGQLARTDGNGPLTLLNQHITIILLGSQPNPVFH